MVQESTDVFRQVGFGVGHCCFPSVVGAVFADHGVIELATLAGFIGFPLHKRSQFCCNPAGRLEIVRTLHRSNIREFH